MVKVKICIFDMFSGRYIVLINEEDVKEVKFYLDDFVKIEVGKKVVYGSVVFSNFVGKGEVGISRDVFDFYNFLEGEIVSVIFVGILESVCYIKKKMYGEKFRKVEIEVIVRDIVDRKFRDIEISFFVMVFEINGFDMDEIVVLIIVMVEMGDMFDIDWKLIMDVYSIGGVLGNKINIFVVLIVVVVGLIILKISLRVIISVVGIVDVVEVFVDVSFFFDEIKCIVEKVGVCLVWGGVFNLVFVDDIMIKVECVLSIDFIGLMLVSIMLKKYVMGS